MPILDHRHTCACRHHRQDDGFASAGAPRHYPPDLGLEPIHLDIALALDIAHSTCAGTVTTTVLARRDGADELALDAVDFQLEEVADADGAEISWRYDGLKLRVRWAQPANRGDHRRLAVTYRVVEPASGLFFSRPDDDYPQRAWYAATDHETERARHWLPCVDLPNVRARLDFHLRAEARFAILANGASQGVEVHEDGTKTAHWKLDWPCPSYLTCFAIGDFTEFQAGEFEGRPMAWYCSREHTPEDLERSFGRTGQMLAWMTQRLGMEFPFPKYYQFALPGFGGAMENISLVSWDDVFVLDETMAHELGWLVDQVNVHEMAHSYFGDAVVCRDFSHAWLKESWATYMEMCWLEHRHGADEQLYDFFSNAYAYFGEADGRYKRPIVTNRYDSSWDLYDMHLYPGGACRLHMLRCELGDEVFWTAVGDYLKRFAGSVVETDDFRRVLEAHSGRSLVEFFEQWFRSPGYPALKVSFSYDDKKKEGTFEVEQTQVDDKAGVPLFKMPLELAWVIDGELSRTAVRLDRAHHTFIVPMAADPAQVRVDPDSKVLIKLDFNPGDEKLRAQMTAAGDVPGRILAARTLATGASPRNLRAIGEAYAAEPFWGVRVRMAQAVAGVHSAVAVEVLAQMVATERDPMVLNSLLTAAGGVRDRKIRDALQARLDEGIPYYRAARAAWIGLGRQRREAPVEKLAEASRAPGWGGIVQGGAILGLASTRRPQVAEQLQALVAYGAIPERARPSAVAALAVLGEGLDEVRRAPLVEQLIDLLRDPNDRVRWAAQGALRDLQATEALGALASFRQTRAHQEKIVIDRAMSAIRAGETPRVAALEKQLDEAREQLRKLGSRLEKLEARAEADDKTDDKTGDQATPASEEAGQ